MTTLVKFLLDEHVWGGLVNLGWEVKAADIVLVQTQLPEGTDDEVVLQFAAANRRILLTSNARDFAPLAANWFLLGKTHSGIIIVPGQTERPLLIRAIKNICASYSPALFDNTYRFLKEFV